MKVNIDLDEAHEETTVTIKAKEWSEELEDLVSVIKKRRSKRLFGIDEDQTVLLKPDEIDYIYAEKRKVFALVNGRNIEIKLKLYELEEMLGSYDFMRFSKSVIGNLHNIERFELSFNGNLCVYFRSGNKEYITRKYVAQVKEQLQLGGHLK